MKFRDSISLLRALCVEESAGFTDRELSSLAEQDTRVSWFGLDEDLSGTGYNPYRDDEGKFTTSARATNSPRRSWRVGFDSTSHDKHIDHFRKIEGEHRTASLKLKNELLSIKKKAKDATPKRHAALKAKFDDLTAKRDVHQKAAELAKNTRASFQRDLESARSAHTAQRKAVAAGNKQLKMQQKAAERESIGRIGRSRIGGGDPETDVADVAPETQWADTPEFRFGIGMDRIASEPEPEPRKQSVLDMLSATRPRQQEPAVRKPSTPEDDERKRQQEIDYVARVREKINKAKAARSTLPRAAAMMSLFPPSSLPGLSKREIDKIFKHL